MSSFNTRRATSAGVALAATVLALGAAAVPPAGAQRPDDDCRVTAPASASADIGLVIAARKAAAAQYAVDHAAELAAGDGR